MKLLGNGFFRTSSFSVFNLGTLSLYFPAYYETPVLYQDSGRTTQASANNDVVGAWSDKSGNNKHVVQSTAGNKPLLQTAIPCVKFDGTDDYLIYAGTLTDTIGSVIVLFKTGATAFATRGSQVLISSADNGTANNWFEIGIDSDGRIYIESNVGGTKHTVVGSTFLSNSTDYLLTVAHDGTDYYVQINDTEQNPLMITNVGVFAWFGDVAGADNIVVGGTVTSAGLVRPFQGNIEEVIVYAEDITQ